MRVQSAWIVNVITGLVLVKCEWDTLFITLLYQYILIMRLQIAWVVQDEHWPTYQSNINEIHYCVTVYWQWEYRDRATWALGYLPKKCEWDPLFNALLCHCVVIMRLESAWIMNTSSGLPTNKMTEIINFFIIFLEYRLCVNVFVLQLVCSVNVCVLSSCTSFNSSGLPV